MRRAKMVNFANYNFFWGENVHGTHTQVLFAPRPTATTRRRHPVAAAPRNQRLHRSKSRFPYDRPSRQHWLT
jgi:hypothetical protein